MNYACLVLVVSIRLTVCLASLVFINRIDRSRRAYVRRLTWCVVACQLNCLHVSSDRNVSELPRFFYTFHEFQHSEILAAAVPVTIVIPQWPQVIKFVVSGHGHLQVLLHLRPAFIVQQLEALVFCSKLIQLKYNPVGCYFINACANVKFSSISLPLPSVHLHFIHSIIKTYLVFFL